MMDSTQAYEMLARSTVAIVRLVGEDWEFVGTGFVISEVPHVLTIYRALEPMQDRQGHDVRYGVTKGSGGARDMLGRPLKLVLSDPILLEPDFNIAVLRIDTKTREEAARALGLSPPVPLRLGFGERQIGAAVALLAMADKSTQTVQPRFFQGYIVSSFLTEFSSYGASCGLGMFELNQPYISGFGGAPVLDLTYGEVIGYLHGGRSWLTGLTSQHISLDGVPIGPPKGRTVAPVPESLALAIDVRSVERLLRSQGILEG